MLPIQSNTASQLTSIAPVHREAFGRLAKLKAAEQRAARVRQTVPPVPPNAATDPRLRAAFAAAASFGAAKALGDRGTERGGEGLTSRQFQRACAAAALPVERAATDVIFTVARKGGIKLSFPRFLEALALVSSLIESVIRECDSGVG